MRSLEFFAPCNPPTVTNQQHRFAQTKDGRIYSYRTQRQKEAVALLKSVLAPYVPPAPLEGALSVKVSIRYPFRISEPERRKKLGLLPKTTRPDADNLQKELQDVMTQLGFWRDDAQIFDLHVSKYWAENPGIKISITEYDE